MIFTSQIQRSRRVIVGRCPSSRHGCALAKQPTNVGANRVLCTHQVQRRAPLALFFQRGVWIIGTLLGLVYPGLQLNYGRSFLLTVSSGGTRCHARVVGQ